MALLIESRHFSGTNYINLQPDKLCIVVFVILDLTHSFVLGVKRIMTDESNKKSVMTDICSSIVGLVVGLSPSEAIEIFQFI
jgi:hypothetical protein